MTREEAIKIFRKEIECMSHTKCSDCILEKVCDPISTTPLDSEYIEAFGMAIEALSVEPCEDTISFPKGTLKKRGKGYVVYNPEWLKENWRTELKVMGIECEDAISRAELLKAINTWDKFGCDANTKLVPYQDHYVPYIHYDDVVKCIKGMPSVTPKVAECEDAISRAAAIKAMDDLEQEDIELYGCSIPEGFDGKRAIEALQSLPSVTPNMSENPTSSNCTDCIIDGTDACSRGAGRAVDGRGCEDFVGESEEEIGPDKKG